MLVKMETGGSGGGGYATGTFDTSTGVQNQEFTISTGLPSVSKIIFYNNYQYARIDVVNSQLLTIYDDAASPKQTATYTQNTQVTHYTVDGFAPAAQSQNLVISGISGGDVKFYAANASVQLSRMKGEWIAWP